MRPGQGVMYSAILTALFFSAGVAIFYCIREGGWEPTLVAIGGALALGFVLWAILNTIVKEML